MITPKKKNWICSCGRKNTPDYENCGFCKQVRKEGKLKKKVKQIYSVMTRKSSDKPDDTKLWNVFSVWVRLRDADSNGMIRCITSGRIVHWKDADAGHFISRKHASTKFDEQNVHAQSRHSNRFEYGQQFEYSKAIDLKYGPGTSDRLLVKSKMTCKRGQFEIDNMLAYYTKEVARLKKEKNL